MYSLQDENIFNIAIDGVFDDAQDIVKAVSNDHAYKAEHCIGWSFNQLGAGDGWVVYYFKGILPRPSQSDDKVSFTVPSGNFGNVCAGHIARQMGLPIEKLVVATNENNVLDEFFKTGVYRVRAANDTHHTSSPSMDISKASEYGRLCLTSWGATLKKPVNCLNKSKKRDNLIFQARPEFAKIREQYGFVSGSTRTINACSPSTRNYIRYKQIIDPHTADGVFVAFQYLKTGVPMVVLETARGGKVWGNYQAGFGRETTATWFEQKALSLCRSACLICRIQWMQLNNLFTHRHKNTLESDD